MASTRAEEDREKESDFVIGSFRVQGQKGMPAPMRRRPREEAR